MSSDQQPQTRASLPGLDAALTPHQETTATPPPFVVASPVPQRKLPRRRTALTFLSGVLAALFLATVGSAALSATRHTLFSSAPSSHLKIVGNVTTTVPTVIPWKKLPTLRPSFERGMATPSFQSATDTPWRTSLSSIESLGVTWVEMPVVLHFTHVGNIFSFVSTGPTPANVAAGVQAAHAAGFSVFLTPLVQIDGQQPDSWVGHLALPSVIEQDAWFTAYWQAWQPYVLAAQSSHVEQMALATEWSWLAYHALPSLWEALIAEVAADYSGLLSYDMNWSEATPASGKLPAWELNGRLFALGISEYMPLESVPLRIDPPLLTGLWQSHIQPMLDHVAQMAGRSVFLSEVGYRDRSDALYQSWRPTNGTGAAADPTEQAAAIDAALTSVFADPHVIGSFFWGWSNTGEFDLSGHPQALAAIQGWYTR